jgi:hypothetical protein
MSESPKFPKWEVPKWVDPDDNTGGHEEYFDNSGRLKGSVCAFGNRWLAKLFTNVEHTNISWNVVERPLGVYYTYVHAKQAVQDA